jgi:ABC-type dipeptide/oligopeptide/nickel transport system permease component
VVGLVLFCTVLNGAGFIWNLFEPVPLYDEVAHFVTPFILVAIVAEVIYRMGGDDEFFNTPRRSIITGAVIGVVGASGWEVVEVILDRLGFDIYHALPDTIFDIVLGTVGGALGAYAADRFLDRLFDEPRSASRRTLDTRPRRPRVR